MRYDPTRHHRRSVRLPGWDYAAAGWYWAICVRDRTPSLGSIAGGVMRLSEAGEVARDCWLEIPRRCSRARLDAFVVMPDHVHGILGLCGAPPPRHPEADGRPGPASLPTLVGSYKSAVARLVRRHAGPGTFRWQRGFYDRIIRDRREMDRLRDYVRDNPSCWTPSRCAPGTSRGASSPPSRGTRRG